MQTENKNIQLGLRENWKQFTLLVIVNAFVGGMIGMERSIFPQYAKEIFGVESTTAILSFITAFGITKAITNYYAGLLATKYGRKNLLAIGWLIAMPIPFILINTSNWNLVVFANILLGINQGLTWSSTIVMKIDLVGKKDRGLAMGINEFAGYIAVGIVAYISSWVAGKYGITPYPFYIAIGLIALGLLFTILWVKDTKHFTKMESETSAITKLNSVFWDTTLHNKTLSAVTQAGLVNNLNDGMIWGLLPIFLSAQHFTFTQIGIIAASYPTVWGIAQLFTGKMSDSYSKKRMLASGMLLQGIAIIIIAFTANFQMLIVLAILLGLGTALVYPTFMSVIAQYTHPQQRAESFGVFRLWRDLGYAIGAIISGFIADTFGIEIAIIIIGIITILSAIIVQFRMPDQLNLDNSCITYHELENQISKKEKVLLIDVRSEDDFKLSHISNAINIPLQYLESSLPLLDKTNCHITVCAKGGGRSLNASEILTANGYSAKWLCGGTEGWLGQLSQI